jgi:hypothetical protein
VNWATWFSQKLQNETIAIQHKARKFGNTEVRPALTIIGHHFLKWELEKEKSIGTGKKTIIGHHFLKKWELEKEETIGTEKKTQNKKENMIVDVSAILLAKKKKKKKNKL